MTRTRALIASLLLALTAGGWILLSHHHTASTPARPPATSPAPSKSLSARPAAPGATPTFHQTTWTPVAGAQDDDGTGTTLPAHTSPRDLTTAQAFLTAFARPRSTTTATQWWRRIRPYLTAQAAADFAGTDPRQVPFTRVIGPPTLTPNLTDGPTTTVTVPTDAGPYQVELLTDVSGGAVHVASCEPLR